jgi:uncharacterized protein
MTESDIRTRYGPFALVTGASSGIGKAFAEVLAGRGLDLVLVARRLDRLEALAAQLSRAHGIRALACRIDLSVPAATREILDLTSTLDVGLVVSNAGFGMKGGHAGNDAQAMTDMLMVNCNVPMLLAHGFIPRLRRRGRGGFIFVASVEGLIGCPYSAAYAASKAMVVALGEGLWAELKADGIEVLTLCPGATESEAAARQGIDISRLQHVMTAAEVVRLALENIEAGPTFISSDHYRTSFEGLLCMPRRDALLAMEAAMRR